MDIRLLQKTVDSGIGKRSQLLFLLTLIILPLIISPALTLSFDDVYLQPKIVWLYGAVLPSAGLVIWLGHRALKISGARPLMLLLVMFLGWLAISAWLTDNWEVTWWGPRDRADGVAMHALYGLVLLAGWVLYHQEVTQIRVRNVFAIGGVLLALWSLGQQLSVIGVVGGNSIQGVVATVAGGPLGHRGYMGGALALLLPSALMVMRRSGRAAWWSWVGAALITWALAGTYTRGTWLAGIAGVGWLAIWGWRRLPVRVWLAVPIGLCLFASTFALREPVRDFSGAKGLLDGSQRTVLWNSAFYGIVQRPIFGWGALGVWRAMAARPTSELLREQEVTNVVTAHRLSRSADEMPAIAVTFSDGKRGVVRTPVNKVHNEYLDYALTYGIPGALMFTVLLGWAIWSGRMLAPALSAGLVAYAVYLLTWPEVIRFAPIAWFMMGICLASGKRSNTLRSQVLDHS